MHQLPFTRRRHIAKYNSPAVYYSFVFSLPTSTDIYRVADNLLRRNIATVAAVAGSNQPRFAYRYAEVKRAQAKLRDLASFEEFESGQVSFTQWSLRHPKLSAWIIRKRLVRFRFGQSMHTPNQGLIDTLKKMRKAAEDIDRSMLEAGKLIGAASVIDSGLFVPSYLTDGPFIRLDLGAIRVEGAGFSDTELVAMLLLHRSGVAILTFVAVPGSQRTTDDLLSVVSSAKVKFTRTVFPGELGRVVAVGEQHVASDTEVEIGDRKWRDVSWRDPIPLQDLSACCAGVICAIARKNSDVEEWMCYTTLFVDGLECCGSKRRWLSYHRHELAGLVMRNDAYASTKESRVESALRSVHGLQENESDFFDMGSALLVTWAFGRDIEQSSPMNHFYSTAVVEGMLVKYWQLRALERRLSAETWKLANLEAVQRELITGLDEYRSTKILWGT